MGTRDQANAAASTVSVTQEQLWFLDQLGQGTSYNTPLRLRLHGRLDVGALERSLQMVVDRHEVLRSMYPADGGGPRVRILPRLALPVPVHDLSRLPPAARDEAAERLSRDDAQAPFDLAAGPLLRATLVRLAADEHLLLVTSHHIVSDGWSLGILMSELSSLYTAECTGAAARLPALPIQYLDYAVWQRRWLESRAAGAMIDYWRTRLAGAPAALSLPYDRAPSPARCPRLASRDVAVSAEVSARLRALGRAQRATLFAVGVASFQALLSRLCGCDDFCIGTPVDSRPRRDLEPLIGYFVETLALRADTSGDPSFRELLARTRDAVLADLDRKQIPLGLLVQLLGIERSPGRTPLVQVMFELHLDAAVRFDLPGLQATFSEGELGLAKFDLSLKLVETGDRLTAVFDYATDVFEAATIERLCRHYGRLLELVAGDPDRRLSDLSLLDDDERRAIVRDWNATERRFDVAGRVHEIIEAQAVRTPDAVAVRWGDATLTYRGLEQRANRLAHHLRAMGVGPESLVAVLMAREPDLIVALLGILKAGGAYLPIDPGDPPARVRSLLESGGVRAVVCHDRFAGHAAGTGAAIVRTGADGRALAACPASPPARQGGADNLAYVIYTSGSTGRPKGVMITHRGLSNYLAHCQEVYGAAGLDAPLHSSVSFDLAVTSLFPPLLSGGAVDMLRESPGAEALAAAIRAERSLGLVKVTPAHLEALGDAVLEPGRAGPIGAFVIGGEALTYEAVRPWRGRAGAARLINEYGPTETVVGCAVHEVGDGDPHAGPVPIGRPIANTRLYVLDPRLCPVPIGVAGELYIGGVQVARGYLAQPDLTADRFVPDPFDPAGGRLYRTGDTARWLPGGVLVFLGRADQQVKVRGFRVEPGEVEHAVRAAPGVRAAAVVCQIDRSGDTRLVAHIVAEPGQPGDDALRVWLAARLPRHMLPSDFSRLDAMPLTRNGKVDRGALPVIDRAALPAGSGEAPATASETMLARLWSELLGVASPGRDDDFFRLGGHSLLATRLVARLRREAGVELSLSALFEHPRLASMAAAIDATRAAGAPAGAISPGDLGGQVPLSFGQERLWFLQALEPESSSYNISGAVRVRGDLDVARLGRALRGVAARHSSLRTAIAEEGGALVARIIDVDAVEVRRTVLRTAGGDALRAAMEEEARRPFDLASGWLLRALVIESCAGAGDDPVVVLTVHHIACDGWSMGILLEELTAHYLGRAGELPGLPVQYADHARHQRAMIEGPAGRALASYWRQQLAGAPVRLGLPRDWPGAPASAGRSAEVRGVLGAASVRAMRRLEQEEATTRFMILLAGYAILLGRHGGQDDVVVGSPVAGGRGRSETEHLIGFFVDTVALRVDLSGEPSFREVLRRTRATTLAAFEHQELPFERVLQELGLPRLPDETPLVQAFLNFLDVPPARLDLGGATVEQLPSPLVGTKFDLTLYAAPASEEIDLQLVYREDRYESRRMADLLAQYVQLIERACAEPDRPIAGHSLVTRRAAAVLPDPDGGFPPPWPGSVDQLFREQAARAPGRDAVCERDRTWSYAELDRAAERVAQELAAVGIERGALVAILAPAGASLIASMLGVTRAGAAFVLLDPSLPPLRLVRCIELARPARLMYLVAVHPVVAAAACDAGAALSPIPPACAGAETGAVQAVQAVQAVEPDDLAYVAFTSGTTAAPRAVEGCHGALSYFFPWYRDRLGLGETDRFSLLSGVAHDPLHREVFAALTVGATICVPDRDEIERPGALGQWLSRQRVTVAHMTPSMSALVTAAAQAAPSLRCVAFYGEPLRAAQVARVRELSPTARVVNLYGATETMRAVGWYEVAADDPGVVGGVLPVGRGIEGLELLVLNAAGSLAGVGEQGDVWFRSGALARGYRGDPIATGRSFDQPDPLRRVRRHRSGDRGWYRADGTLVLAGRSDDQIKINGFRVSPDEVAACLRGHPRVRDAAVVGERSPDGGGALIAYVVADEAVADEAGGVGGVGAGVGAGAGVGNRELRAFVRDRMPAAMVPAHFVALSELPVTSSGKLDRARLPAPVARGSSRVEPRTATEAMLREIWREVLRVELAGVHDSFFELGGHSLLATQVLMRVRQRTGVALPIRTVFEEPTIARLAARVDHEQRGGSRGGGAPPITRRDRGQRGERGEDGEQGGEPPLSFAQERLWFLYQLDGSASAYNLSSAVRVRGSIDVDALAAALSDIADRHEVLRTSFGERGGLPYQRIHRRTEVPLATEDVSARAADQRVPAALACIRRQGERPFDLERGPLFRAQLVRLGDGDHALAVHMHHIVSDGWSMGVLVEELSAAYQARRAQPAVGPAAPALPVQYGDYATWQRGWMERGDLGDQVDRAVEQLAGVPAVLDLPTDRPRPPVQSFRGATEAIWFEPELVARVAALAADTSATPAMCLLSVFGLLLQRYSGQRDFAIGAPIANRQHLELEPLIGFFANTIVFRLDLAGNPPFRELLARVREHTLAVYANQDAPFEKVVERLQPERDLSRNPVFQVMFAYQNTPARSALGGLETEPLPLPGDTAKFDLELRVEEQDGGLRVFLEYSTDLFEQATAARMLGQFRTATESALADPQGRVEELAVLDEQQERASLHTWNATGRDYPLDRTFSQLFAAQVERAPRKVAAFDGATRLTYEELAARASRVAASLARDGAGPETLVALVGPRDVSLLTAIVGVLRAGAAYLPIDPAYPPARIRRILDSAAVRLVVCGRSVRAVVDEAIADRPGAVVVRDLDEAGLDGWDGYEDASRPPPPMPADPAALAYAIFTSGSTGQPKGVMIDSRGMVNHLCAMVDQLGLDEGDVLVQNASQCFDVSVWQFLCPLIAGGRVRIVGDEVARDPVQLVDVVRRERVTLLEVVPSLLREVVTIEGVEQACSSLRWLLATGEALPPDVGREWLERVSSVPLMNAYGPAECSDDTHLHRVVAGDLAAGAAVPVGLPIGNLRSYVLDAHLQPCPIGVKGELFVGGAGVGRGYLAEPARTAEMFVPDPFSGEAGGRLFRTRDVVSQRAGGVVEFRGRADDQIKLRGFRIELGEVESALARAPGVRAAAAACRTDAAGHTRLVAYVVLDVDGAGPDDEALRASVAEILPEYMMPSVFVPLEALPMSANGKLDRKALPAVDLSALWDGAHVAPRSQTERDLAAIWCAVLGLESVGVTTDFFRIGGHSLLATQVISRVRQVFGVSLPLRRVFESPTIEKLAEAVELAEIEAADAADIARLMDDIAGLSEEEVQRRLADD